MFEVTEDSVVEVGDRVELGRGEQVDEMSADVVHVLGCRVLDPATSGWKKADQDATGVGGVGLSRRISPSFSMRLT